MPFEDKPVEIKKTGAITSYEISVYKYREYYNFENAEQVVDDFLRNVRSKFRSKGELLLKCGFLIENIQQSVQENLRPIVNNRYWAAEPFKTTYFNDYIFYSLRENILKRVIVNAMSGSSWRFRRFIYLNLKSLNLESEIVSNMNFVDSEAIVASDNEDEVSDVDSLKSFIDDKTEIEEGRTCYYKFENATKSIDETLAEEFDESMREIEDLNEVSFLRKL